MSSSSQVTDFSDLITIYGLCDPRTGHIRYVGKAKNADRRIREHLRPCALRAKTHKIHWLKSLLANGISPILVTLATVSADDADHAERAWIAKLLADGADLTNGTDGGEGDCSPEGHKKQADALRGRKVTRSAEHAAKIVQINKDRAKNPAWLVKIKLAATARAAREKQNLMDRLKIAWFAPRTKRYELVCIGCGKSFVANNTRKQYCRRQCGVNTWKRKDREARSANVCN